MVCKKCNSDNIKILKSRLILSDKIIYEEENYGYICNEDWISIISDVLKKFIEGRYSLDEISTIYSYNDERKKYNVQYYCHNCKNNYTLIFSVSINIDNYYTAVQNLIEKEYNDLFYKTFKVNYNCILKDIYYKDTIYILFDRKNKNADRFFKIFRLNNYFLDGKGADGFIGNEIVLVIILGLVSAFLYDILKLGLKKAYNNFMLKIKNKEIKKSINKDVLKKYLLIEKVEINEDLLEEIIEKKTMDIINDYLKSLRK